jgi:hypothetical protein
MDFPWISHGFPSGRPSCSSCVASSCGAWRRRTALSNAVPCCRHAAEAWSRTRIIQDLSFSKCVKDTIDTMLYRKLMKIIEIR